MATTVAAARPSFGEAFLLWLKIGCINFGGPAGQIALMHRTLVDEKKWVDEARFLHALNFCMLLPGPEAQKLATYLGWLLHGVRGGLSAGILFVLPGAFVMLGLSLLYALGRGIPLIDGALFGIKAAVLVIVIEALFRIGKRALKSSILLGLAAAAFVGTPRRGSITSALTILSDMFLRTSSSSSSTTSRPGRRRPRHRQAIETLDPGVAAARAVSPHRDGERPRGARGDP